MSFLKVDGVSKSNERGPIVSSTSFELNRFTNLAIAGETGSGKTTLLKMIAGLITPDTGNVYFEGERLKKVPEEKLIPGHPGIAYLSQHFDLPHFLRVKQVLEYANELESSAATALYELCHINHLLERRTDQLSGGEMQRIALAKLLTGSPRLLLLDEPFSNTDPVHKELLKRIIHDLGKELGISIIMISHDPVDSLSWANEIMVMKDGRVVQRDDPHNIYYSPLNEYVAGLFGKFVMIDKELITRFPELQGNNLADKPVYLRPNQIKIAEKPNALEAMVASVNFYGLYSELELVCRGISFFMLVDNRQQFKVGENIYFEFCL